MGQARKISQAMVIGAREEARQIASTLIEESGFHVIEADGLTEADDLLTRHGRKITFVFAEAGNSAEARALAALISKKWPWIRLLVSMEGAALDARDLPSGASQMHKPWRPLDLLIEAERAMH
jgi:hypothetical protein